MGEENKHPKMSDEKKEIIAEYEEYFKEDLDAINEELSESKKYSEIINREINSLSAPGLATKGSQHYLIEHITNAVELQTQREGLRKDKVAIKKAIMDYAIKALDKKKAEGATDVDIMDAIAALLDEDRAKKGKSGKSPKEASQDADAEIDDILDSIKESD